MKRSIVTPRRALVSITILLVVTSFLPARVAGAISSYPHHLLVGILSPISTVFLYITTTFRPALPHTDIIAPDKDLNRRYLVDQTLIAQLEQENAQLKGILQRFNRMPVDPASVHLLDATVIAVSNDPINPVLTIDRGTSSGVHVGFAAVWWEGLVGRVVSAGPRTADVRLITAEEAGIEVRIVPLMQQRPPGPITDLAGLNERAMPIDEGSMFFVDIDKNEQVNIDDVAHLHDRLWPDVAQGFIVGQVVDIIDTEDDPLLPLLLKRVLIEPTWRPLGSLNKVTILVPGRAQVPTQETPQETQE